MSGRFITLEGIEGVGKSTNATFVADLIEARGFTVVATREPGGTPVGERLRDVLLHSPAGSVPPLSELLLMFAARAAHLETIIRPALARGAWVVCDRFTDASYAYQGGGRGLPDTQIEALEQLVQGDLQPDLTILLDATPDVSAARRAARGTGDRFEAEENEFFTRVREKYLARAAQAHARIATIDAGRPLERVQAELSALLATFLDNTL